MDLTKLTTNELIVSLDMEFVAINLIIRELTSRRVVVYAEQLNAASLDNPFAWLFNWRTENRYNEE